MEPARKPYEKPTVRDATSEEAAALRDTWPTPPMFMCFGCSEEFAELGPGELCKACTEVPR